MKNKFLLSLATLICFFSASKGQEEYMVGTSRISIEPDSTLVSVALSGYGFPAEGRFSISWIHRGDAPGNITAVTAFDGNFFAVDSDHIIWSGSLSGEYISWKKIGTLDNIKVLAGMNSTLYAVNDKEELLIAKFIQGTLKWRKIADAAGVNTLTASGEKLYASNNKNELMKMYPLQNSRRWINIGHVNNKIKSMTICGERLFAIDPGDSLWRIRPGRNSASSTEIGRFNGITFNIHVKQLVVLNNRLYAISVDNKLYISAHSSDGDLSATAIAIKRKKKIAVLVGVDLTGFNFSLTDHVKEIVSKERNIPKSAILINASHTHFSPSAQAYLAWQDFMEYPDSVYLNNIVKKGIVKVIENAIDSMSPADLYFGRGTTNIGKNRSAADPENPLDKTLDVLEAKNRKGKVTAVLFLAACHAVFNNESRETYTISANFPGTTRDIIHAKTGANAIFIQGCAGDINPRSTDHKKTGKELADDISRVINEKMTKITGDISYSFDTVNVPIELTIPAARDSNDFLLDSIHIKPWRSDTIKKFQMDNAPNFEDLYARRNAKWAGLMLSMIQKGTVPDKFPEYVQIIHIGNWNLLGLSREAVNEYGPAIRNIWPDNIVSVAGYCNDVGSYLPNKWHVARHFYEGYDSFFWYGQPGVPPLNVFEIIVNGIKSLKH